MSTVHPTLDQITVLRHRFHLKGQLQGVGFRPFVHNKARLLSLTGWICNDASGVTIEVQGPLAAQDRFAEALQTSLPRLARIESAVMDTLPVEQETDFVIRASHVQPGKMDAAITVDAALCPDCRAELLSQHDRRSGHAMITCTNCGPRFSIIQDIPYDRPNTTMAEFEMCPRCAAEYADPTDRRFHAQPICCPDCGPKLWLATPSGEMVDGDPIDAAAELLAGGKIVAIKGIGGFHLAVRADRADAVSRLRTLKQRDSKPFALMVEDLTAARRLAHLSAEAEFELASPAAPILVASRTVRAEQDLAPGVAPGTHLLGLMLPYTPIHHLLFEVLSCRDKSIPALVMTSGNLSDEPLVIENADAFARLGGLCDAVLLHDRPIQRPIDDSIMLDRGAGNRSMPVRRSRGYVPTAWEIGPGFGGHPTGICVGGELKNTIAVVRENDVIVSGHLGDLTHPLAYEHFQKAVADFTRLFKVQIQFVAHDTHPNYTSTRFARQLARQEHVKLISVQHHLAHAQGVMAEQHIDGPALALVCDGTGYGLDGTTWGGELLFVNGPNWKRLGSLRPMRMPGGDAAAVDTRRSALAMLQMAYGDGFDQLPISRHLFPDPQEVKTLAHMIRTGFNSPWASSTGRVFDGISALLGLCSSNQHEAQAAMALEAAAHGFAGRLSTRDDESCAWFSIQQTGNLWRLDLSPFVRHVVASMAAGEDVTRVAEEFHYFLAKGFTALTLAVGHAGIPLILSGGTMCNQVLCNHLIELGAKHSRRVLVPAEYPPTDAGLAFGQAAVVLQESRGI